MFDCTDWRLKWLARHEGWYGYCFSIHSGAGRYQDYSWFSYYRDVLGVDVCIRIVVVVVSVVVGVGGQYNR